MHPKGPFALVTAVVLMLGMLGTIWWQRDGKSGWVTGVPGARPPDWHDLKDPQWGLLGKASARKPHPACALCFTVPALDAYQIYEYIETDLEEAIIIPRRIPNPAPPYEGIWKWVDEDGEETWYIGTQEFGGPTDEEKWSDEVPLSTIELQRIMWRNQRKVWGIPGVQGLGIGARGFAVSLLPGHADSVDLLPTEIEGVPVEVEIQEMAVMGMGWDHDAKIGDEDETLRSSSPSIRDPLHD